MNVLVETLQHSTTWLIASAGLLGLLVGSFLNVVIYRLPVMMMANWRKECREFLELEAEPDAEPFNLVFPLSRCPLCHTEIRPQHNIPVLSYLWLKGRCADCGHPIAMRYPLIEAFTGLCSAIVAWHFGYGLALLFGLLLTWALIALSFIDIDHQLLPDQITLPFLWLGLLLSLFNIYTSTQASLVGAIAGYLSLWSVYWLFKLVTGKEGMGYGDFKLLALLGAWFGWQYLPMIVVLSSLVGAILGIAMVLFRHNELSKPLPFGPYLAAAGWLAMIVGEDINRWYWHSAGL